MPLFTYVSPPHVRVCFQYYLFQHDSAVVESAHDSHAPYGADVEKFSMGIMLGTIAKNQNSPSISPVSGSTSTLR